MKTIAVSMVLFSTLLGSASAFAVTQRTAFILVNWSAPAFVTEARSVEAQLNRYRYDTYLFDSLQSDGLTIKFNVNGKEQSYACVAKTQCGWQAIVEHFLPASSVKADDQVLFDIQGDGTAMTSSGLKLADGHTLDFNDLNMDIDSALAYEEFAKTFKYPGDSPDTWATHSVEAYFPNMLKSTTTGSEYLFKKYGSYYLNMIATGDLLELAKTYAARKAKVMVLDHSCQGGATTKILETLKNPLVCGVSTTGINSPGIQGTPALSTFLADSTDYPWEHTMAQYASYISNAFYSHANFHPAGNRIHQIGFSTGCTKTMPVREMADNAMGAYGTWWDWTRSRPSHAVRNPERYATPSTASADAVWSPKAADPSFAADCKASHKNCDLTTNPRLRVGAGWVRWFEENLAAFVAKESPNANLTHLKNDGEALLSQVKDYGRLVKDLDAALTNPENKLEFEGSHGLTADAYLRRVLTQRCLCPNRDAVKRLNLDCSNQPDDQLGYPNGWSDSNACSNPSGLVTSVLTGIPARYKNGVVVTLAPLGLLTSIQTLESGTLSKLLIQVGLDLQPYEESCASQACNNQNF